MQVRTPRPSPEPYVHLSAHTALPQASYYRLYEVPSLTKLVNLVWDHHIGHYVFLSDILCKRVSVFCPALTLFCPLVIALDSSPLTF